MTTWRTSSYSNNGSCVAVADLGERVAIRNSNHPDRGSLAFPRAAVAAFVAGCSAGELESYT